MQLERGPLLADSTLTGARWCARHSALIDEWLGVAARRRRRIGPRRRRDRSVARRRRRLRPLGALPAERSRRDAAAQPAPRRDVDRRAGLVSDLGRGPEARAQRVHAARSARDRRRRSRHRDRVAQRAPHRRRRVAHDGSRGRGARAVGTARRSGGSKSSRARVDARHAQAGEVAFMLEPDLKEGRGGLRDVHSLHWAQAARVDPARARRAEPRGRVRHAARRARRAAPAHRPAEQRARAAGTRRGRRGARHGRRRRAHGRRRVGRARDRVDERRRVAPRPIVVARSARPVGEARSRARRRA